MPSNIHKKKKLKHKVDSSAANSNTAPMDAEDINPTSHRLEPESSEDVEMQEEKENEREHQSKPRDEEEDKGSLSLLDQPQAEKRFRDYYMSRITSAFGEDLNKIRQEEGFDTSRLGILIDSLETFSTIYTDEQKQLSLSAQ
ncbi:uncharacterized protein VTP21DRAFT_4808 [Calcarisporiella thermophila]|uniref:uncharacterized protein n=1 Tax=Calcarisporiella thermophila TaxID=911321 RepID=UPI003743CB9C